MVTARSALAQEEHRVACASQRPAGVLGAANPIEARVASVEIQQAYDQLPIALLVNLANGILLAVILWEAVSPWVIGLWLVLLTLVTGVRYALLMAFRKAPGLAPGAAYWRRRFVAGACAIGVVWGLAGYMLFHPSSFAYQAFLAFVLGGMVAGAVPLLSVVDRAYPYFAIPVVVPIVARMIELGDRVHWIMGLMILIFGIAMLASSARMRRVLRDAVELRLRLSASIETERALERMLRTDALTGVANRLAYEESLAAEWRRARREDGVLALITADIDHFKDYNDRYGHQTGDHCLVAVAQAMQQGLQRPGDLAARTGGEEFAFVLPNTPPAGAMVVAERIRQRVLALHLSHEGVSTEEQVTVSLGVATTADDRYASVAELQRASDRALYQAKRGGRNRVASVEQGRF